MGDVLWSVVGLGSNAYLEAGMRSKQQMAGLTLEGLVSAPIV